MAAPRHDRIFVLMDSHGLDFGVFGTSIEDISEYIVGDSDERIFEYRFVAEHPINIDLQQDPEEGQGL